MLPEVHGVTITNSFFKNNTAGCDNGDGGAVYVTGGLGGMTIANSFFSENEAGSNGGHGGHVAINGGDIMVINTTFFNSTASGGRGGAKYSVRSSTNISLTNNTLSDNTAAYSIECWMLMNSIIAMSILLETHSLTTEQ